MKKSTPLWCEDCRFVCFETGLRKPMLTLNDPNGLKNTTNVYSIHLELRMALPCQISTGKWKYVNLCLDFLGKPDQRTAYVKRQARPRWTYVRRSSVTPDLIRQHLNWAHPQSDFSHAHLTVSSIEYLIRWHCCAWRYKCVVWAQNHLAPSNSQLVWDLQVCRLELSANEPLDDAFSWCLWWQL